MSGSSSDTVDPSPGVTTPSPVDQKLKPDSGSFNKGEKTTLSVKRSNSTRSKGINFNLAISPISTVQAPSLASSHKKTPSFDARSAHLPQLTESSRCTTPESPKPSATEELKYDLPLPPTHHLMGLDIDEQLRLLALKEMSIVEIKDSIANLTAKLQRNENELHSLREVIQKSLYKELTSSSVPLKNEEKTNSGVTRPQRQNSNPREEAIASTKNKSRRRTLSSSSSADPAVTALQPSAEKQPGRNSTLWSNLSKPLNLIQQFDTMLQHEFEKSMIPQPVSEIAVNPVASHKSRRSEDSISSIGSVSSPLTSKSRSRSDKQLDADLDQYYTKQTSSSSNNRGIEAVNGHEPSEDMLQAVSTSIWSFVNDVKSNVLSSLGEEDAADSKKPLSTKESFPSSDNQKDIKDLTVYNLDTGSTVSLQENEDSSVPDSTVVYNSEDEESTENYEKSKVD